MNETILSKISRKINQEGRWTFLFNTIQYFFYGFFAILLVLLIRIFSVFFIIRFAPIDKSKIGRAYFGDWYLSEKKNGEHKGRYLDIFYFPKASFGIQYV